MTTKSGSVKWFDGNKGFGFIADDDGGSDILLHANVLRNYGHSSVVEGTRIEVEVTQSQRGLQATEIVSMDIPEIDPEPYCVVYQILGLISTIWIRLNL